MRSQSFPILVAVLLTTLAPWGTVTASDQVAWAPDLPSAQKLADQRNQLVLLHFWSPDCEPCQRLEHTVFKDPTFGHVVSRDYVPVKVNVKQAPSLAYQYGVNRWPMDVITTADGRLIHKMDSPHDAPGYTTVLDQLAAQGRVYGRSQIVASEFATPAGPSADNQIAGGSFRPHQPPYDLGQDRSRVASGPVDYYAAPSSSGVYGQASHRDSAYRAAAAPQSTQPGPTPPSGEMYNPYASRHSNALPPGRQDVQMSPGQPRSTPVTQPWNRSQGPTKDVAVPTDYASRQLEPSTQYGEASHQPWTSPAAPGGETPRYGPRAGVQRNPYASAERPSGQVSSPSAYPQQPPADLDHRRVAQSSPDRGRETMAPFQPRNHPDPLQRNVDVGAADSQSPAAPSWGLEGYCPVSLVDQSKWVKGDPRWGVVHRGRTYLFSSVDAKQRFWAQPDRYAPALAGIDPVLFTDSGQQVDGKRNHGVVYRDQVYLFSSEETLQRFWRSPENFAEQVRQAAKALEGQQRRR
jgi:YHS domain-containing protein/thiol-disulfide isomerase/thioredoxin